MRSAIILVLSVLQVHCIFYQFWLYFDFVLDHIFIQTLPLTDDGSPRITPHLSRKSSVFPVLSNFGKNGHGNKRHGFSDKENVSFCII